MSLRIDAAAPEDARAMLRACCGSLRWVNGMLTRRPFGTREALLAAAGDTWFALEPSDWLEAFADHPKIGDGEALRRRFADTRHLAAEEQSGVRDAGQDVIAALADANAAYERRFGYIFIVCATGRGAEEMLARLRARLDNDPETELAVAAEEQARITALRLMRL